MALEFGFSGRKLGFRPGFVEKLRLRESVALLGHWSLKNFKRVFIHDSKPKRTTQFVFDSGVLEAKDSISGTGH